MKQRVVSVHASKGSLIGAEIVSVAATFLIAATGAQPWWAVLAGGAAVGLLLCVLQIRDVVLWRWIGRAGGVVFKRRPRTLQVGGAVAEPEQQVKLPDGSTQPVRYGALADAVRGVAAGKEIRTAYRKAKIIVGEPQPQTHSSAANFGDVGVFDDHDVLALGGGWAYQDRKVISLEDLDTDGPHFRGWFRPPVPGVPIDIDDPDGNPVGVLVDGNTVVTMVSVWGKAHIPTVLYPERSETPNLLPLNIIADYMRRVDLEVDVDVIVDGARTTGDAFAVQLDKTIGGRSAAGQRATTLVVRMDTRDMQTVTGLSYRPDTAQAVIAATRRIVFALQQAGCRARILVASQMRDVALEAVGGRHAAEEGIEVGWNELRQRGRGYLTSYYFSAEDLTAEKLDEVWSYAPDPNKPLTHTTLVLALRRGQRGINVSAVVRVVSPQPLTSSPAPHLNRAHGWQWEALQNTMIGSKRLTGLPSVPVTAELDAAIAVGPSGVLIGALTVREGWLLMPFSDPAAPTRIVLRTDDDRLVRKYIRRSAANGERVAVYDTARRWTMAAASSHIWTTSDSSLQPPWQPTLVVHNGDGNPYRGAWSSVSVEEPVPAEAGQQLPDLAADTDIQIEAAQGRILLRTRQIKSLALSGIDLPGEQPFLN